MFAHLPGGAELLASCDPGVGNVLEEEGRSSSFAHLAH